MGVVYRAYDNETRREVTLKTLLDVSSPAMLELFRKECDVLSRLNHPNIVDIYDIGEFVDEEGKRQPYFVMPLLPGTTLDHLIADASHRLTAERVVDIVGQACRGLEAAHERGLIHRDIKPSNIFVLEGDAVKLIDFGVAHLASAATQTSIKGTLHYMAPEQVQAGKPSPLSDLFSIGVVCYETLTRRRPFEGASTEEIVEAILNRNPPLVCELNPAVNRTVSQVVHKALAKHPSRRFSSVREFGEALQKAVRGDMLELFDESRMGARLERARKAFLSRELEFAAEIVAGLEEEGYGHPDLTALRADIDRAQRDRTIAQLLERARRCVSEDEPQLALQRVQEILQLEPAHREALELRQGIETARSVQQIGKWMALASQHLENQAYDHARQALEDVLRLNPEHADARRMLSQLEFRVTEHERVRKEKEDRYQAAMEAWRKGEVSSALTELERVMSLVDAAPDKTDPSRAARYQDLYNQVRSEQDALRSAYDDARGRLAAREFEQALSICEQALTKYSGHALFQSLQVDVKEAQRQDRSAFVAQIDRKVQAETDLDRRVSILREALTALPGEPHFERALQLMTSRRDLVNSIVRKAQRHEEARQFSEALNQWNILSTIYPSYPGLNFEVERLVKRREQQSRNDTKARSVQQIDLTLAAFDWDGASELAAAALAEFPDDGELKALLQLAAQGQARAKEAAARLEKGRALLAAGDLQAAAELEHARQLDDRNPAIAAALAEALLAQAQPLVESDPQSAAQLVTRALEVDPASTSAKTLRAALDDRRYERFVEDHLSRARQLQASGDLEEAIASLEQAVADHPRETRLTQLRSALGRALADQQRSAARDRDLEAQHSEPVSPAPTISPGEQGESQPAVDAPAVAVPATPEKRESLPQQGVTAQPARKHSDGRRRLLTGAVLGASAIVLSIIVARMIGGSEGSRNVVAFAISTEPAGANLSIDGKPAGRAPTRVALAPGSHRVEASLQGYAPLAETWDVRLGFSRTDPLRLTPLLVRLQILSDLPDVKFLLDGDPRGPLAVGEPLELSDVPLDSEHTLQLGVSGRPLEIAFRVAAATVPEIRMTGESAQPVAAVGVFGDTAKFHASATANISIDGGQSYLDTNREGVPIPRLPADGVLTVRDRNGGTRNLAVLPGTAPTVQVFLLSATSSAALGAFNIECAEPGFSVLVDGRRFPFTGRGGPLYPIYNVPEGQHTITIQKPGYRVQPASAAAEIRSNARPSIKFSLIPIAPIISVQGGTPGMAIEIAGRRLTTDAAGQAGPIEVQPGPYEVSLAKDGHHSLTLRNVLSLGSEWVIGPPQSRLPKLTATVRFLVTQPKTVRVEITQVKGLPMDVPKSYAENPPQVVLPVGIYHIDFSAPGYATERITMTLDAKTDYPPVPVSLTKQ